MATIDIDFSQNLGNLPRWQRYTTALRDTRDRIDGLAGDSEDTKLLKAIDMKLERVYYGFGMVCPTAYDFYNETYQWTGKYTDGMAGNDELIYNVLSHGAQPLLNIGGIPLWLTGPKPPTYQPWEEYRPSDYTVYEKLVYDILYHLKTEVCPQLEYVSLMNEVLDSWDWYNECYEHTSHAVDTVNNALEAGIPKIKLGGKDDYSYNNGYFPTYPSFLDYIKDSWSTQHPINLDFLTWHIYDETKVGYFGLPPRDTRNVSLSTQKMKEFLDARQMNPELFIAEWCNRGDDMVKNLTAYKQCEECTWTVAGWSVLMATGINAIPIQFGNMDYGQTYQSILVPDAGYISEEDITLRKVSISKPNMPYPDGTYLAKYNIYKMLKMSKDYLVSAGNETINADKVYIIASKDSSGIAVIIANHKNSSQSVTVNFSNIPSDFQQDTVYYREYLVDMTHGVFDSNGITNPTYKNSPLVNIEDNIISPISNFNKTFNMSNYSTIFVMITSDSVPCPLPQFEFQITQVPT